MAPAAAAAASVGADKRQTVVEARREEQDNVTITGPCGGGFSLSLPSGSMRGSTEAGGGIRTSGCLCWVTGSQEGLNQNVPFRGKLWLF